MVSALHGIKVIELSQVLAGPFCGYQLALLGAEVIKVEPPHAPDCARGRGPDPELNAAGLGLTYQVQGANKQSLALDLRDPNGRDVLLTLLKDADVFLENHRTGAIARLGLDYDTVRQINPRIIYCAMTGYGDTGPKAERGAYDNTIQAASGIVGQCGGVKPAVSFVDYAAGYSAAFAIAAALLRREATGLGNYISTSMLEVALSLMAPEVAAEQYELKREKGVEAGIQAYETETGRLMLGCFKPDQYRQLGDCLKNAGIDVPALEGVMTWEDVWARSADLIDALNETFVQKPADAWLALLHRHDIPAELIVPLSEAAASKQVQERGYFTASPDNAQVMLPLAGYRMAEGGPELHRSAPELGADSQEILENAGLSGQEITALRQSGVVQ